MNRGIAHKDLTGDLRRWADGQAMQRHCTPVIYGQKLYIFGGSTLITVLNVPPDLIGQIPKR